MGAEVPEYYQSLVEGTEDTTESAPASDADAIRDRTDSKESETTARRYRGDAFQLTVPNENWRDQSTYILQGPRRNGISHNVTITVVPSVNASDVRRFAEKRVDSLLVKLHESRLLVDDHRELHCGHPARRAIVSWATPIGRRLYQEQLYVLHERRGFTLTASFTRATRKLVGEEVEEFMLGFHPISEEDCGRR